MDKEKKLKILEKNIELLNSRNVKIEDIASIVYDLQVPYNKNITLEFCIESIHAVLSKREILHAMLVGIELDVLSEKGLLSEPLQSLVANDEGVFGVDETIAIGGCYGYGSIAVTTFGYLDKLKPAIIGLLDSKTEGRCNTFLDDLVCMIAANACGRVAHHLSLTEY